MSGKPTTNKDDTVTDLRELIISRRNKEKEVEAIVAQLQQEMQQLDKLVGEHDLEWLKQTQENIKELVAQLQAAGLILTAEEIAELSNGLATISAIREKRKKLKELAIDLAESASAFAVVAYDAVVSALSRGLVKIDNKTVTGIIKQLNIITKANAATKALQSTHAKQYDEAMTRITKIKEQLEKISLGLTSEQKALLETVQKIAGEPTKAAKAAPTVGA